MKKRICLIISALTLILSLTGCVSSTQQAVEHDQDTMEQVADIMITSMSQMDAATFEGFRSISDYAIDKTLYDSGLPIASDDFVGILNAWEAGAKEAGAYIGHGDWVAEVSNKNVKLRTQAQFEDMDATIEFVFNEKDEMESLSVGAKYTTGQILKKAGMNTVIGMGTVFSVLIFISFLISLMKYIPVLQAKFIKSKTEASAETPAPAAAVPVQSPPFQAGPVETVMAKTDELELAAVISAAIAQAEGVAPEGFVVRSIIRRTTNKWNGGR